MPEQDQDVSKLTIGTLVTRMRPAQLWGIIAAIVVLVGGASTLMYRLGAQSVSGELHAAAEEKVKLVGDLTNRNGEIEALERKATELQVMRKRIKGLEEKERYLALYVRFLKARADAGGEEADEENPVLAATTRALCDHVHALFERYMNDEDGTDVRSAHVAKGAKPTEGTITFAYDRTSWPFPGECGLAAAAR